MAKEITQETLDAAVQQFCDQTKGATWQAVDEDGKKQCRVLVNGDPEIFLWLESGSLRCSDMDFGIEFNTNYILVTKPTTAPRPLRKENIPPRAKTSSLAPVVRPDMPVRDIQVAELTFEDIKTYICPTANDQEVMIFLKLCQARNLNPFLRESYLIKYDQTKPAQMVTGKEHFTKKAEEHPQFDGYRAGIIVETEQGENKELEGTFMGSKCKLVGGWAEVSRKDRKIPFKQTVALKEFDKGMANWKTMPGTMIRKCALVQCLRECFPSDLSGCYDSSEVGLDPEREISV